MTVSFKAQIADYEQVLYKQATTTSNAVASNGDVLWPHPPAADNNHFKSSCKLYPGYILYDYTQMFEICMLSGVLGLPKSQVFIFLELNVLWPLASIFIKENAFYSDYQFPIPITIYCSIFLLPVVDGVQYNDESLLLISFPRLHTNPSQEQGYLQGFREAPTNN